ncbi:MAG: CHASE2 domain-containing protein [Cyclobacteriaceae bacterium]|nr:CHASE2 domain-containing protein [Cyclobacteriaceae bacterium]
MQEVAMHNGAQEVIDMNRVIDRLDVLGIWIILIISILVGCETRQSHSESKIEDKSKSIVLLDIDLSSRQELAIVITKLAKCEVLAIGIYALFEDVREGDSDLIESFIESGKVVLTTTVNPNGEIDRSYTQIEEVAMSTGLVNFAIDDNYNVAGYYPLYEDSKGQELALPIVLAEQVDMEAAAEEFMKSNVGKAKEINRIRKDEFFPLINPEELSCEKVKGKIVIIGSNNQDKFQTSYGRKSGILLIANIVEDILN